MRRLTVRESGHDDNGDRRRPFPEGFDDLEAIDLRHEDVDEHHVEVEHVERVKSVGGTLSQNRVDSVRLQPCSNGRTDLRIVIYD